MMRHSHQCLRRHGVLNRDYIFENLDLGGMHLLVIDIVDEVGYLLDMVLMHRL